MWPLGGHWYQVSFWIYRTCYLNVFIWIFDHSNTQWFLRSASRCFDAIVWAYYKLSTEVWCGHYRMWWLLVLTQIITTHLFRRVWYSQPVWTVPTPSRTVVEWVFGFFCLNSKFYFLSFGTKIRHQLLCVRFKSIPFFEVFLTVLVVSKC